MLHKLLRRLGLTMTCGFFTVLAVLGSIVLYVILSLWLERFAAGDILIVAIIPVILAPLFTCFLLRTVLKLEIVEKDLLNSEARFRSLYENATIGIYRKAPDGRILLANPALVKMLGYASFEELAMRNLKEKACEPAPPRNRLKDLAEKDDVIKGLEAMWRRKDGSLIIVRENARAIRTEEGGILYYEGTVEDVTGRRKTVEALRHRVGLERLVNGLSALFINPTPGESDKPIEEGLKLVGDSSAADRSYVFVLDHKKGTMSNSHEWCRKGIAPQLDNLQDLALSDFRWWMGQLEKRETIFIPHVEDLPEEAAGEKKILMAQGIKALISVPMAYEGKLVGFLGLDYMTTQKEWEKKDAALLRTVGDIFVNTMERKRAEDVLRQSEERFRRLFKQSNDVVILHRTGEIVDINQRACEMLGYSREQLLTMSIPDLHTQEDHEALHARLQFTLTEKPVIFETQWKRADGSLVDVEVSSKVVDPENRITQGIGRDITERKRAAEALEREKTLLEKLFDNPYEAIAMGDVRGRCVRINQSFTRLFGYRPHEAIGRDIDELITPPELREHATVMRSRAEKGERVEYETRRRRKDGTLVDIVVTLAPVIIADQLFGAYAIWRDITERTQAEEEKKRLEGQLVRAQKMEAIGTLAGGVAHDLNNILSGIVSYPELLLMDLPPDSPLRKPILAIQKSGERAAGIVQDLLTLARRGVATTEVVNLNQIVRDYLKSPEYNLLQGGYEGIDMVTDLEPDLMNVLGSTVHLSKSLMNLMTNAAEAMPGGGTIRVSTRNRYVDRPIGEYDSVEEGDYVLLRVSDMGVGIPRMDFERIFEPFYTKKVMGRSGTGLGMAVVWGTVKDHRGYIDIQSEQGKGSTFTLYFPVTRRESPADDPPLPIESFRGRGESILVVDDVEEQRQIASRILGKLNYAVTTVSSGEEALEYLSGRSADLVLLDMIMDPGMDGLETYRKILELHPGQRAIIVSGFSETSRVKEAQRLGAGAYIRKPYLMEKIVTAVRTELDT